MAAGLLADLTLFSTFICLGLTLWFAIYLLSRSRANPLAFRAIVALVALAVYFTYILNALMNNTHEKSPVRLFAITIALIAWHDLSFYLLDEQQRRKRYALARGLVLFGVVAIVLIFTAPQPPPCDPVTICPTTLNLPSLLVEAFNAVLFGSILYNLWLLRKTEGLLHNMAFFLAILVGIGSVIFSVIGTLLDLPLTRLLPNLLIIITILLLAYSVAHDRTFVTHQVSAYDLPVTLLTMTAIVVLYILVGRQLGLSGNDLILITLLVVFTHSAYDFVRDYLDQLFRRQQRQIRRELDALGRNATNRESVQRFLSRGLAILCKNLNTWQGLIALRKGEQYSVVASFHSLPVGTTFPAQDAALEGTSPAASATFPDLAWLAPGYAGSDQLAVVGVGARLDKSPYAEDDLLWLEDIAHEIAQSVHFSRSAGSPAITPDRREENAPELVASPECDQDSLLSALAYKPDQELVNHIEDGFQHLSDYDFLGESPLVEVFGIQAADHLERGKLVHEKLIQMLEKLRPFGQPPAEPLPRAWYAYTILYDSYVKDCLSRDIMGKLYIGEGTYYRLRRQALRGITRAVLEMGSVAS